MKTFRQLVNYVAAEPFRPFRIRMASGDTLEIRHPEMIQVGRTTCRIFTWMNEENEDPREREREREISILLIESIEPLNPLTAKNQS